MNRSRIESSSDSDAPVGPTKRKKLNSSVILDSDSGCEDGPDTKEENWPQIDGVDDNGDSVKPLLACLVRLLVVWTIVRLPSMSKTPMKQKLKLYVSLRTVELVSPKLQKTMSNLSTMLPLDLVKGQLESQEAMPE